MPLPDHLEAIRVKVSNWGRWGDDDQLRHRQPARPRLRPARGAAAVRSGSTLLAGGRPATERRRRSASPPAGINALLTPTSLNERDEAAPGIWEGTDDIVTMCTCAGTHIDALATSPTTA